MTHSKLLTMPPGEACLQKSEKRCGTDGRCNLVDSKPDPSSNQTPFDVFYNHRSFNFFNWDNFTLGEVYIDVDEPALIRVNKGKHSMMYRGL
jgi:hypothetical protein